MAQPTARLMLSEPGLQRLSAWLAWTSLGLATVIPASVAALWFLGGPAAIMARANLPMPVALDSWQWLLGGALALVPSALLAAALLAAARCFRLFRGGVFFSADIARALRSFAARVVMSGLAGLLVPPLLSVVMTWSNPPGSRALAFHVGSTPVLALFFGGVLWAIAAVMARAADLADEHAQIV
ncbi:hypothetical protein QWY84_01495 [Aquisalimonas lutea]|uniref:hypothetical protein n=1 Tax=Aquisalimonas lutea TaxID=1327750 RepID=UPI0025B4DA46|nr:hypothetical protein [Aquisalimonas lutea]MDN3516274.1 hypothetical protein [Aquisalimonas lutea]